MAILTPVAASAANMQFHLDPKYQPQTVSYETKLPVGSVVVDPKNKFLYLVEDSKSARGSIGKESPHFNIYRSKLLILYQASEVKLEDEMS